MTIHSHNTRTLLPQPFTLSYAIVAKPKSPISLSVYAHIHMRTTDISVIPFSFSRPPPKRALCHPTCSASHVCPLLSDPYPLWGEGQPKASNSPVTTVTDQPSPRFPSDFSLCIDFTKTPFTPHYPCGHINARATFLSFVQKEKARYFLILKSSKSL